MATAKKNTATRCEELAAPIAEELGLWLWDVRFEKEGGGWYLRFLIDKEGGVDLNDCERFSRAVEPTLDVADPIEQSYCLEVSSPGVERDLKRPWHFEHSVGKKVRVCFIRAQGGKKELVGRLTEYTDGVANIETPDGSVAVDRAKTAYIRWYDDYYDKENDDD